MSIIDSSSDGLREEAVRRLEKRSEFWTHLAAYVLVNAMIVVVWYVVAGGGFFWPIFPLFGWGIGVFFHAWEVFRRPPSEARVRREMERLHQSRDA